MPVAHSVSSSSVSFRAPLIPTFSSPRVLFCIPFVMRRTFLLLFFGCVLPHSPVFPSGFMLLLLPSLSSLIDLSLSLPLSPSVSFSLLEAFIASLHSHFLSVLSGFCMSLLDLLFHFLSLLIFSLSHLSLSVSVCIGLFWFVCLFSFCLSVFQSILSLSLPVLPFFTLALSSPFPSVMF